MHLQAIPPSPDVMRSLFEEFLLVGKPAGLSFEQYLKVIGFSNPANDQHGMDDALDVQVAPASRAAGPQLVSVPDRPVVGSLRVMVLLVDFSDRQVTTSVRHYEDLLFSKDSHTTGSMRDYFHEVSLGKVDVTGEVHGWFRMPQRYSYYTNNESGTEWDSYPRNAPRMVEDAVQAALDTGVVFDQDLDNLDNNTVTALFVVHAGIGAETQPTVAGQNANIWSHKWLLRNSAGVADNLRVTRYLTVPHDARVGVCAHELGHLAFQWEDFYDPDGRENGEWDGSGDWDLMAGGSYNGNSNSPAHPMAWHKSQHGWIETQEIRSSTKLTIEPFTATTAKTYKLISSKYTASQALILENRSHFGFDEQLPGEGLLVWRTDQSRKMVAPDKPALQLVQADGLRNLERVNDFNQGDSGDPFPGTSQRSFLADSGNISTSFPGGDDSQIELKNIQRDPATGVITLDAIFDGMPVDDPQPPPFDPPAVVFKESSPSLHIEDFDPAGVQDTVTVTESGSVRNIKVAVNITHTYIGDLLVELVSPTGLSVALHNKTGGSTQNLVKTWTSADTPALSALSDASAAGDWSLRVSDHAARDDGQLNRWSLEIHLANEARNVHFTRTPNLQMLDNDPTGVSDVVRVRHGGTVRSVKVGVDIPHTYIGDLKVELIGPAGDRALLHNQTGGDNENLKKTWESSTSSQLAVFTAKSVRGDWVLRASDHASRDIGTLKEWTLDIELAPDQIRTIEKVDALQFTIPDNNAAGIARAIFVNEVGAIQSIEVGVDISHTYVGDLRVELISPSGDLAILHNNSGGNDRNLALSLSSIDSPLLEGFVGLPIRGNWILRVIDSASRDEGTLDNWSLKLTYSG